jgi:hypothetical protein
MRPLSVAFYAAAGVFLVVPTGVIGMTQGGKTTKSSFFRRVIFE